MTIPRRTAESSTAEMASVLREAGCLVVENVIDKSCRENILGDLESHMQVAPVIQDDDPEEFYPGRTRRVTGLVMRSDEVTQRLIPHPISKDLCDAHLLPNSQSGYQLHVTAALEVGPGARGQILHREEDSFKFFPLPRPNLIVASMWAISDFRADNGATYVVPDSHRWPADRQPQPTEILQAEMSAGSVLFWLGGLLHGAGPNTAKDWRYGVILTYSAGWVRQEENQYLNVSQSRIDQLDPELRSLIGMDMYEALGFSDPRLKST